MNTGFIVYSRKDKDFVDDLKKHLNVTKKVEFWYDGEIKPGDNWDRAIKKNLNAATVILLCISVDFFDSNYIKKTELKTALRKNKAGEAIVLPIIVGHCQWDKTEIGHLQALPQEGKPVPASGHRRDKVLTEVCQKIFDRVEKLTALSKNFNKPASTTSSNFNPESPKRRGRPSKSSIIVSDTHDISGADSKVNSKKVGRPLKAISKEPNTHASEVTQRNIKIITDSLVPKRRGRPKTNVSVIELTNEAAIPKSKRGRPRKTI